MHGCCVAAAARWLASTVQCKLVVGRRRAAGAAAASGGGAFRMSRRVAMRAGGRGAAARSPGLALRNEDPTQARRGGGPHRPLALPPRFAEEPYELSLAAELERFIFLHYDFPGRLSRHRPTIARRESEPSAAAVGRAGSHTAAAGSHATAPCCGMSRGAAALTWRKKKVLGFKMGRYMIYANSDRYWKLHR
jgi:hypothetical protein